MRRAFRNALPWAAVFCAVLLCATLLSAQQNTADIVGTVMDSSGAVLPGASVTLTNTATNVSQAGATTGSGDYTFTLLVPSTYAVKVAATGFKTATSTITVAAADRTRVDFKLVIGDVTQTVEVSGSAAPALQTENATVTSLVTSQAVEDVPLNGRNFINLVQLSAGATIGPAQDLASGNRPDDRRASNEFSVNGQGTDVNNQLLDGMDNNERSIGSGGVRPSVEAIQEVNVQTNMYDASVGRTAGGVVNVITKSGTNSIHGSAYEFFRNAVLNANPLYRFNLSQAPQANPPFRQNQYGGSVGGPIRKDKTFFFGDFEQFKLAQGVPPAQAITVPSLCERGTAMVAAQAAAEHVTVPSYTCPTSSNPALPGNFQQVTTISGLNGVGSPTAGPDLSGVLTPAQLAGPGVAIFSLYPLPTSTALVNNFFAPASKAQTNTTFDGRVDEHFSDKDTLYGRYSFNNTNTITPTPFPVLDVKAVDPTFGGTDVSASANGSGATFGGPGKQRAQGALMSYVHVFRPNLVMDLQVGYMRYAIHSESINTGKLVSNDIGIHCDPPGTTLASIGAPNGNCVNFPGAISAQGLLQTYFGPAQSFRNNNDNFGYFGGDNGNGNNGGFTVSGDNSYVPLVAIDNNARYSGGLTWSKNSHSLKFGAALIRRQVSTIQSQTAYGANDFTGAFTGVPGGDLLEGLSTWQYRTYSLTQPQYRDWEPGAYFQDDWRARHWLTVNLGIRDDIFTPFTEKHGLFSNFNPITGTMAGPTLPGNQRTGSTALVQTYYKDVAPRLGFAATIGHNMVIRGGYGLSYFPSLVGSVFNLKNAPFNSTFLCQTQSISGGNQTCNNLDVPIASNAVAHYSTDGSLIGQTGGNLLAAGAPIPSLNIASVFVPANCTLASCPNNPYATGINGTNMIYPHWPDGRVSQANLQIQKDFAGNVLTIGFVNEMGRHLPYGWSPNSNPTGGPSPLAALGGFPWLNGVNITQEVAGSTTSYNGLQKTLLRRFKNGLTFQINYAYSHALLHGSNPTSVSNPPCAAVTSYSNLGMGSGPAYEIPCSFQRASGPVFTSTDILGGPDGNGNSPVDVRNRISGTFNYQLPFGKSSTGAEGMLLKGWGVNGAFAVQSGDPYTINASVGGRPLVSCNPKSGPKTLADWGVNSSCFALETTPGVSGVMGAFQLNGPDHKNLDFSLFKEFPLFERVRMQFRTEVFNLFNTPNFLAPGGGSNPPAVTWSPASGSSTFAVNTLSNNYIPSREIQFALKLLF